MATPTITYNSSFPIERDDIELVKMFLAGFKDENGRTYKLKARPDVTERKEKAIEAIAESEDGRTLAIEHTYIQPFEGERADAVPFQTVFEQFRTDSDLSVPNRFIDVIVPAFAVEKGVNWKDVAQKVREWFLKVRDSFPKEGEKWYTIPDVGFKLDVLVQTFDLPETNGALLASRLLPKGDPFRTVLQTALEQKVPKLTATSADSHILLFQDGGTAIGFSRLARGLDENVSALPDIKKLTSVWTIHTMEWKSRGHAMFVRVWPGWTGQRFWISDERFAKKASPEKWLRLTASKTIAVEDEIRLRAYWLYVQQGRRNGFALDDWLQAEAEILGIDRQ
jgi:hypothetical protein